MNAVANTVAGAVATETVPGVFDLNVAALPGLVITPEMAKAQAEQDAIEAKLAEEADKAKRESLARFDTNVQFKLEGEVVGRAFGRKVSKTGAVSVTLNGKKELSKLSGGLKGFDLDMWSRMQKDVMKGQQGQLMARLVADKNWTGGSVKMSAKGDKLTIEVLKAADMTVGLNAQPTDEQVAAKLGISMDELKAFLAMRAASKEAAIKSESDDKAKAIADEKAAQELAAEEAALAKSAEGNGEVHAPESE